MEAPINLFRPLWKFKAINIHVHEFLSKLKEYERYFRTAETKEDIETKFKEFKLLVLTTDDDVKQEVFETLIHQKNHFDGYIDTINLSKIMLMFHILLTASIATDDDVMQKAFETLLDHIQQKKDPFDGYIDTINLSKIMLMFHILLTASIAEPPIMMIQLIQKLLSKPNITVYIIDAAVKYLDKCYQGLTPSESFHTIHDVWKSCPKIEFTLQMTYCDRLLEKKEYEKLKYLISTEMELFVSYLLVNSGVINLFSFSWRVDLRITMCTVTLIIFHTLSTSAILMIQLIQKLSDREIILMTYDKYFNIFYQGLEPLESIHTIHNVWKSCPKIELALQMTYCGRLLKKKEYEKLKYIISTEMEIFVSCLVVNSGFIPSLMKFCRKTLCTVTLTVTFYVLHCSLFFNQPEIRKSIGSIVSSIQRMDAMFNISTHFYKGLCHCLMLLDKDQYKYLIYYMFHAKDMNPHFIIGAIINASVELMANNYHDQSKHFLQQNLQYLKDYSISKTYLDCKTRHGYSLILLLVLHECSLCEDTYGTELAVTALCSLKVSLLHEHGYYFDMNKHKCYCYMGSEECEIDSNRKYYKYGDPLFLHSKLIKKYGNSYRRNKEDFVKKLKELDGKLYHCKNKRQQLDIEIESSSKHPSDLFYPLDYWDDDDDDDGKEYYLYYISAILGHVADDCREANALKEFVQTLCQITFFPEVEDLCIEAIINSAYIKLNQHNNIAQFVLDINKDIPECSLLTKLTFTIGECVCCDEKVSKDKKKVLYKCFRKARYKVNSQAYKCINIDEYRKVFTFIKSMDKEEEMEKIVKFSEFLIIVMLLLMSSVYGGHHKSAEMKKYLSLKYEYDKAVLYLLWCSGDVEINPGPTLRKLKNIPISQKLRTWIWDMCSISLKILKGISVNSKPKDLWKDKPANWPCDQPFYDPRNKSKGGNKDVKSDDRLLKCILDLCSQQLLDLSQYQSEIAAWRDENKKLLFELYTCRMEIQKIKTYTQSLINYKDTLELQQMLGQKKIQIDFSVPNFKNEKVKGITDIIREVAVLLCKISQQIPPMEKSDGIWKTPPIRWKAGVPFYSPHNTGARSEKGQDKNLVNNLVEYIETENINIPPEYAALVTAWKQQNMQELFKLYTIHTNVAVTENALKYLKFEGLLDKPDVLDKLKHEGLTLSTEWFDGCSTSTGICNSNQASTSHQNTYVNQSIAQQNSANLNSKGQNGSQPSLTDYSIHAPSYRKRSSKTSGTQEAKGKCQNKKRKYDENTTMKKKRQNQSSNNASLPNGQTCCIDRSNHDPMLADSALKGINNMDFLFATTEHLANDENSVSLNETVPSTQWENQNTSQHSDHHSLPPIQEIDSLQELNQKYSSVKSPQEQPVDNHTISVSTGGQSDDIVAQNNQTIDFPSSGKCGDKVAQGNQTISVQHDAIVSQDNENASKSRCNHTDTELSENPENDELLNKMLANYTGGSVKWENVDDPLIKDMDPLVSWINDNDNNS